MNRVYFYPSSIRASIAALILACVFVAVSESQLAGQIEMDTRTLNEFTKAISEQRIERLDFSVPSGVSLSTVDLERICKMRGLKQLGLTRIPAESASLLGQLTLLETMNISFAGTLVNYDFLSSMKRLNLFYLRSEGVYDSSLRCLKGHSNLRYIGMASNLVIDDAVVDVLETIPDLRSVGAISTDISMAKLNQRLPKVKFWFRKR